MLPRISKGYFVEGKNSEAAIQFAEWAQNEQFYKVVAAYADCHNDPNIDDSFIRTLVSLTGIILACFFVVATICYILGYMTDVEK